MSSITMTSARMMRLMARPTVSSARWRRTRTPRVSRLNQETWWPASMADWPRGRRAGDVVGDAGEAVDVAGGVDASGLSPERRARLLVDVARAHAQRRQAGVALTALREGEQVAPEQVRGDPLARAAVKDLVSLFGRRTPPELVELARRCAL